MMHLGHSSSCPTKISINVRVLPLGAAVGRYSRVGSRDLGATNDVHRSPSNILRGSARARYGAMAAYFGRKSWDVPHKETF